MPGELGLPRLRKFWTALRVKGNPTRPRPHPRWWGEERGWELAVGVILIVIVTKPNGCRAKTAKLAKGKKSGDHARPGRRSTRPRVELFARAKTHFSSLDTPRLRADDEGVVSCARGGRAPHHNVLSASRRQIHLYGARPRIARIRNRRRSSPRFLGAGV
jgi:hypothetical protein